MNRTVLAQRLMREKAASSEELQVSLAWNDIADLDLHVLTPSGTTVYFGCMKDDHGGFLDVDMNAGSNRSEEPVENVFWAKAPAGAYKVTVNCYAVHVEGSGKYADAAREIPFTCFLTRKGVKEEFSGVTSRGKGHITCFEFVQGEGAPAPAPVEEPEPVPENDAEEAEAAPVRGKKRKRAAEAADDAEPSRKAARKPAAPRSPSPSKRRAASASPSPKRSRAQASQAARPSQSPTRASRVATLEGKSVYFVGKLEHHRRGPAQVAATDAGATVKTCVSSLVDIIVRGRGARRPVPYWHPAVVIDEAKFNELVC